MNAAPDLRMRPAMHVERALLKAGCTCVAGIDEAGRGAWAGPVVAAAVVLPLRRSGLARELRGVRDSKAMRPAERLEWSERIACAADTLGVGEALPEEIDALGLLPATRLAMSRALAALRVPPDHLLLDYILLPEESYPQTSFARGERRALSIAAASVIAKVKRDRLMVDLDALHPGYGFGRHKGYGTPQHKAALDALGPSPIHRRSYAPVAARLPQR